VANQFPPSYGTQLDGHLVLLHPRKNVSLGQESSNSILFFAQREFLFFFQKQILTLNRVITLLFPSLPKEKCFLGKIRIGKPPNYLVGRKKIQFFCYVFIMHFFGVKCYV
jgi:hypothetical protein